MRSAFLASWALLLGVGLMMLGNGLQGSLLGIRASGEGFSTAITGLVMTGYFAGFLAGSTVTPKIVGTVGHVRVFAALASLASVSVLVHAVFLQPWVWVLMRLCTGFAYAGLYVVTESWLNDRATNENRGRLLSIYMVVCLGGMAAGQWFLNLASPLSFELFVLSSALVSLALIPVVLSAGQAPTLVTPQPVSIPFLYRSSPLGVVSAFGTGMAHSAMFSMGAVYAVQVGLSVAQTATFMSVAILGGMLCQWPVGLLSDRFDRRQVITGVTLAAATCALGAAMLGTLSPTGMLVTIGLFGGLSMPMYSLGIAHTNDHLRPEQMVAASSSLVLVGGIGATLGPMSAATLMSWLGPSGFLVWLGGVHLVIGLFALYRMTRRASPAVQQSGLPPLAARTSPVAAALVAETAAEELERARCESAGADSPA